MSLTTQATTGVVPDLVIKKMMRKVMWLPVLLGIISIIDRSNISYAALKMNAELGFTATAYGFGAGVLFLGYVLFEVPSNILMRKFGARAWLARIALTWGVLSALTGFAWNEPSFYVIRFLIGVAEAGLFPGVVLYLTLWFPSQARARANALFMTSVPVAMVIAAPISGVLVGMDNIMGIHGWQFMFIFWGVPAVLLGFLMLKMLPNGPEEAKWLSVEEKRWLSATLASEAQANVDAGRHLTRSALKHRNIWVFSAIYICYGIGQYGMIFFLPQVLKRFDYSPVQIGLLGTLPFIAGLIAMVLVSRHSDKTGERRWHFTLPLIIAALSLMGAALSFDTPVLAVALLTVTGAGLFSSLGNFWARPTAMLTGAAAAVGFAVINSVGNLGGFVGPYVMGFLQDASGGSNATGLIFMSGMAIIGSLLSLFAVKKLD
jgi:ACS family tartrate transporter-like MFS transporter